MSVLRAGGRYEVVLELEKIELEPQSTFSAGEYVVQFD
jgi:hypothetical protein